MFEELKLAWRNIWRNKRRTIITTASVFFAMFFALIMSAFVKGTWDQIVKGVNETITGYIQIQGPDYYTEPFIDNLMPYTSELQNIVNEEKNVKSTVARLQSYGLASTGNQSKFTLVLGVDPEMEDATTELRSKIATIFLSEEALDNIEKSGISPELMEKLERNKNVYFESSDNLAFELGLTKKELNYLPVIQEYAAFSGAYLDTDPKGILIGGGMAKFFGISVGDSLIILGSGYHGSSAAGIYKITGVVDLPGPEFNRSTVYMRLKTAQELYSAFEIDDNSDTTFLVSYLAVNVHKTQKQLIEKNADDFNIKLGEKYKAYTWREVNMELKQMYEGKIVSSRFMVYMLFLIVAFGVFGTVLMMTAERKREFGIMIAIGMKKTKLRRIVTFETIIIGLIGCVLSLLVTFPIILIGHSNPIRLAGDYADAFASFNLEPVLTFAGIESYIWVNIFTIMILVMLAAFYPVFRIGKIKVINAIRGI